MIDYQKVNRGDILKIVGGGAPGYAANGDLVRALERTLNGVKVEDKKGETFNMPLGNANWWEVIGNIYESPDLLEKP